ncbi:MAG: tRNA (adenosine(37)-N6)-dimethylallyltransferase MiaA [Bacteroidales bacterium]|nr:tRNA (adenosine(37)-N6)-dimethylallyltransferase MiaA [Bacteroidales bacterium]
MHTLVVIAGPTAVGKTGVAIEIARHFNTIIISGDSRQFYNELKIGTAAPTPEQTVLAPHFLTGHLSVHDYYNVSRFENDVLSILNEQFPQHKPVILVGGSGLYLDAVCKGIDDLPDPDPHLRKQIELWHQESGIEFLTEKLESLDPDYYKLVDKSNPSRLKRAIEVCMMTGKTYTSLRINKRKSRDFKIIKIGLNLPREELNHRIALRTDQMISDGLVAEVTSLLKYRHLNALNTVGYKEIFEYLDGKTSLEQAIENIKTNTRRYAKRQLTWFKRDQEMKWFSPEDAGGMIKYVRDKL